MSLDADLLLDRRRLKRRLALWRVLAVVGFAAVVLALVGRGTGRIGAPIARVNVHGLITEDTRLLDAVTALANRSSVKAVIVDIDSPGGTVSGGETLRAALAYVAGKKPVVAVMHGTAASAGYMVATAAERIFAREGTLTGSIGVILQTGEVSGLLGKLGISAEAITSGPLKDQPSLTKPLSPEGRQVLHGIVEDMYEQFVALVAEGRHMDPARVRELGDGRPYTGRQALTLGLVDAMGGEIEAKAWLHEKHGLAEDAAVRDVRLGNSYEWLGQRFTGLLDWYAPGLRSLSPGAWAVWRGDIGDAYNP